MSAFCGGLWIRHVRFGLEGDPHQESSRISKVRVYLEDRAGVEWVVQAEEIRSEVALHSILDYGPQSIH